ncbi:bcl-2-binding component 3, isoforms 3/4-like [Corvus hawaiiensis]|uniref:bcl-2-binding component 3, isoforms 3/4-like n=1 Tax=Corvus hawaiiensis TaxID=134902 RepID=UPI0020192F67|nr:bcl-2-binding component 3, isoforms 3/4-like [Corvus hawaiiensis]
MEAAPGPGRLRREPLPPAAPHMGCGASPRSGRAGLPPPRLAPCLAPGRPPPPARRRRCRPLAPGRPARLFAGNNGEKARLSSPPATASRWRRWSPCHVCRGLGSGDQRGGAAAASAPPPVAMETGSDAAGARRGRGGPGTVPACAALGNGTALVWPRAAQDGPMQLGLQSESPGAPPAAPLFMGSGSCQTRTPQYSHIQGQAWQHDALQRL